MSLKAPMAVAVIATSVLSAACSVTTHVPNKYDPIFPTVVLEASSNNCLAAGRIDVNLHEQIHNDAKYLQNRWRVAPKHYSDRVEQAEQSITVDSETCQLVAQNAIDLKVAVQNKSTYPLPYYYGSNYRVREVPHFIVNNSRAWW